MYWNQMIDYCESKMDVHKQRGKYDRNSFMPLITELSLSDCHFEGGNWIWVCRDAIIPWDDGRSPMDSRESWV
ncbi:hypothetical protein J3458_005852 [Metarhizium acridum]|uniref:uncharacterized protein n=1 Tax=Metarhizium acridum TaxID=92637 RepID=UPI001C6D192C|nr:hypothetical protein J3458_005852 [Metarhizium acridum]